MTILLGFHTNPSMIKDWPENMRKMFKVFTEVLNFISEVIVGQYRIPINNCELKKQDCRSWRADKTKENEEGWVYI